MGNNTKILVKRSTEQQATLSEPLHSVSATEAKKRILGLDLGFVQTKAVWGNNPETERVKFSSIVKRRSEVALEGIEDAEGYLITLEDESTWNVGAKGVYDFTADRLTNDSDLPKLFSVLGIYQQRTAHAYVDLLVTGLPVDDYNAYKDQFGRTLENSFRFGFGSQVINMQTKKVVVIAQSAGAYYDFALSSSGGRNNTPLLKETVLVMDFGGRTSDGCIMEKSRYSQDSFTIYQGVWAVQNELRRLINKNFRYPMHPAEVDMVLRTGTLVFGGSPVDVSDLKKLAIETIFPTLRDEMSLHVSDFRRFASILLAGGGAYLFQDYIEEFTNVPVIVLDDAEYSNASGYLKYGRLLLGE